MNKIRKFWKDNGTPYFFHVQFGKDYVHINHDTCLKYDKIQVQDDGCTALDALVDISCVDRALDRCQDQLVISLVKDALKCCLDSINYFVSIKKK